MKFDVFILYKSISFLIIIKHNDMEENSNNQFDTLKIVLNSFLKIPPNLQRYTKPQIPMSEQNIQKRQPLFIQPHIYDTQLIENISILIVGVGGIGCQLLKVLCKMKLKSIHIIDMDTIELSNLNRQFLFKNEHKGMSKSLVAKETIKQINPFLNIEAHHMNIKQLPIDFYKQFNFLVMALDNIEARNYVNKIGIRLGISVLDAGTLAYKGNVKMIIPGKTQCYSCQPKTSSKKQYPVCTIRMRPEKPIHCIVWAKMLFEVFFSGQEVNNDMKDLAQLAKQGNQTNILLELLNKQILTIKQAKTDSDNMLAKDYVEKINPVAAEEITKSQPHKNLQQFDDFDKGSLSNSEYVSIAKKSFSLLMKQLAEDKSIIFQKDDDNIIHFISSMANLRMKCFAIEQQSFNQVKNMAGNIVPAIASTNSIVSGLQVTQMFKLVFGDHDKLKFYYVQNQSQKIRGLKVEKPIPSCHICSQKSIPVTMWTNFFNTKFQKIVKFLDQQLKDVVDEYSINLGSNQLYNSEEPNKILMAKTISSAIPASIQLDLVILDEENSEKICTFWIIHTTNPSHEQCTNMRIIRQNLQNNKKDRIQKQRNEEQQRKRGEEGDKDKDSDVVYMDKEDSDEIVIVDVKKDENTGKKCDNIRDQKKDKEQQQVGDKIQKRINPS